jgi:2-methylcitrate dehydratase PrpD
MIHSASIRHHPLHVTPACLASSTWAQAYVSGPNLVCAVNSILQALAQLDFVQLNSPAQSNLSSANLGPQSSVAAFGDLSH